MNGHLINRHIYEKHFNDLIDEVLFYGRNNNIKSVTSQMRDLYIEAFNKCESPIELTLVNQLILDILDQDRITISSTYNDNFNGISLSDFTVSIQPTINVEINDCIKSIRPDFIIYMPSAPSFALAIECDGHYYHTSTKTVQLDKIRDRALKHKGVDVFRFTGAEIHHNVVECSQEIIRFLNKSKNNRQ